MTVTETEFENTVAGEKLKVWGLTKNYGAVRVLDDVSLEVEAGEFVTLLGPSGSGKTTMLMAIAGFVEPTHGHITADGKDITDVPADKRDFGVVFQGYALFPHLTVAGNIAFPLKVRGMGRAEREERVRAVLKLVRLEAFADRKPRALSGGQQQRVALARALAFRPKILLLDEPMGALDRQLKAELQVELRRLHHSLGTTFINVTHDQEEAMTLSDRIAIMERGKIVEVGSPHDLYARPRTKFVAGFLGKSNFIEGKVGAIDGDHAAIDIAGTTVRHRIHDAEKIASGDAVTLALRPERIDVADPGAAADCGLDGTVADIVPCGATVEISLKDKTGREISALMPSYRFDPTLRIGAPARLIWPADAAVIVKP